MAIPFRSRGTQTVNECDNEGAREQNQLRRQGLTPIPLPNGSQVAAEEVELKTWDKYRVAVHQKDDYDADSDSSQPALHILSATPLTKVDAQPPLSTAFRVKSKRPTSPEVEIAREKPIRRSVRIRRSTRTPPRMPFRRTLPRYRTSNRAGARQTRCHRPSKPVSETRPKIYLHLCRENVDAPWKLVPRPQLKLRLRRATLDAPWKFVQS